MDQAVYELWVSMRHHTLTPVVVMLTTVCRPLFLSAASLIASIVLFVRGVPVARAGLPALAVIGTSIAVELVKVLIQRPRPPATGWLVEVSTFSFPSGHAAAATACAVVVWIGMRGTTHRWVSVAAGVLALCIATSRLYVGVHWLSDVIAGALIGASFTLITAAVLRKISTRHPTDVQKGG
ncbi:MAG: phosphatase PAP2 family protein [Corynebacterium sp.]|uniref:phosphatase PAP2 family protein n=1 Tax=Corynebacterium sp. TaxID=1720 RepID=UPI0026DBC2D9|nr:phosphatase PAP2 family protein [Corynebacterium sp.]MDO4762244.1 phosphatase PAP2 family protein [Corynebacterium sp.]